MLIEFLGVPGVGKSTIARLVAEEMCGRGLDGAKAVELTGYHSPNGQLLSRRQVQIDRIVSIATQPALARAAFECLHVEGRGLALSWMINIARRNRAAKGFLDDHHMTAFEEGPLSAICLAWAARSQPWSFEPLLKHIHLPDLIVSLEADPNIVYQRIVDRAGILSNREQDEVLALQTRYRVAQRRLEASLAVPILTYNTIADPAERVASRICSQMTTEA